MRFLFSCLFFNRFILYFIKGGDVTWRGWTKQFLIFLALYFDTCESTKYSKRFFK